MSMHFALMGRAAPPARGHSRGQFAALLRKDLAHAAPIVALAAAMLTLLVLFAAAAPLLGEGALEMVAANGDRGSVVARIGSMAPVFWCVTVAVTVLSAVAIAVGDRASGARHLLPALPVSARTAYLSKLRACTVILLLFTAMSTLVELMLADGSPYNGTVVGLLVGVLALGTVWAFVAPGLSRGFAGTVLVAVALPTVLIVVCVIAGDLLARIVVKAMLAATDAAAWHALVAPGLQARHVVSSASFGDPVWVCAASSVLLIGIWAAWRSRAVVLCQRSPKAWSPRRFARVLACASVAVAGAGVAKAAINWRTDPAIRAAAEIRDTVDAYRAKPTPALVRLWADHWDFIDRLRTHFFVSSADDHGFRAAYWQVILHDPQSADWSADRDEWTARQILIEAVRERLGQDPEGVRSAAKSILASDERLGSIAKARVAELVGPRTRLTVLLKELSQPRLREEERLQLTMLLVPSIAVLDPSWDRASNWTGDPGAWLANVDRASWGLAPFELACGGGAASCPTASVRAAAVILVAILEQRINAGSLDPTHSSAPHDQLAVDEAVLRAARATLELPFPRHGDAHFTDAPWLDDGSRAPVVNDEQSLYLPATQLFDLERTDPVYLLPERQ